MKLTPLFAGAGILLAAQAYGIPSVYVKNSELRTINVQRSAATLIADINDPKQVWVLPPHSNTAVLDRIKPSTTAALCNTTKNLLASAELQENRRQKQLREIARIKEELAPLKKKVDDAKAKVAELLKVPGLKAIVTMEAELKEKEAYRDKLIEQLGSAETAEEIKALKAKISQTKTEIRELGLKIKDAKVEHSDIYRQYKSAALDLELAAEQYEEESTGLKEAEKKLAEVAEAIRRLFDTKAKIVGGEADITFDTGWSREASRLQQKHSSLKFSMIPTYNNRLNLAFLPTDEKGRVFTDLPTLIGYGTIAEDLFFGDRRKQGDPSRAGTGFSDQPSMSLYPNLLGTCPAVIDDFFEGLGFDVQRGAGGKPLYSLMATYEYDIAAPFDVEVSYNLWRIYQLVASQSPLYGTISQTIIHGLAKKPWPSELLTVSGQADAATLEEIKLELIGRVLATAATPSRGDLANAPAIGLPAVIESYALAYGQNPSCGTNIYCQSKQWTIRLGDAVFGEKVGGEQTSSKMFKEGWDTVITESWNASTSVPKQGFSGAALKAKPGLSSALVDKAYKAYQALGAVTMPADMAPQERAILYGFHVGTKFDSDVLGEAGLSRLVDGIFDQAGGQIALKNIPSKADFKKLVFPDDRRHLATPAQYVHAKGQTGGWTSAEQLSQHIADQGFVARANANQLSAEEWEEFDRLMSYEDALGVAEIDQQLTEISELLRSR